jgi:FMN-dependent oxidoreductase (nitrilotriacetate monooxygenase family)
MTRQIHLLANFNPGVGYHPGRWRRGDARDFLTLDHYVRSARAAERAKFDAVFVSDVVTLFPDPPIAPWHVIEPTVALGAITAVTSHVGLVATLSTSFNEPYNLARRISSIDHLSGGRAAWNVVASAHSGAARNFGEEQGIASHAVRYSRATEFVDVVRKLWDSWEDDALVLDQAAGTFVDPAGIHPIDHRGEWFSVAGPFQNPRSPQGQPVLVQAGTSPEGIELGTSVADVIFVSDSLFEHAQRTYADVKRRIADKGRDPDQVRFLPAAYPIVGATEQEARDLRAELDELRVWDSDVAYVAGTLGIRLEVGDLDTKLGALLVDRGATQEGPTGVLDNAWRFAQTSRASSLRDFIVAGGTVHRQIVGAPEQIADDLERWFTQRAADGFNLSFTHFPDQLEAFAEHVVPVLQQRGLFRREYEATTLRGHLGLPRPDRRFHGTHAVGE